MKAVESIRSLFWRSYLRFKGAKVGRNMKVGGPFNIVLRDDASLSNLLISNSRSLLKDPISVYLEICFS